MPGCRACEVVSKRQILSFAPAKDARAHQAQRDLCRQDRCVSEFSLFGSAHPAANRSARRVGVFPLMATMRTFKRLWAREHGLGPRTSLTDVLKAQIEEHRADVFYNHDATGWDEDFVKSLPGCVKASICWHAAPFRNVPFSSYDLVVCNFPAILATIERLGGRTDYFFPAYDPEFTPYAARQDRPVDVMFVGGYSRHHQRRAEILDAVAQLADTNKVVYHLDRSRLCRLAESPLGRLLPLAKHRRPPAIQTITHEPKFGRDYYEVLSEAKIVLNGAIDMSGDDRGNMRCFEALGSRSLLLSEPG